MRPNLRRGPSQDSPLPPFGDSTAAELAVQPENVPSKFLAPGEELDGEEENWNWKKYLSK